jgi:hypothetical protein
MPIDPDVQPLLDAITQRQAATDGAIQNILDAIRTMQATDATQHSTLTTLNGVLTTLSSQESHRSDRPGRQAVRHRPDVGASVMRRPSFRLDKDEVFTTIGVLLILITALAAFVLLAGCTIETTADPTTTTVPAAVDVDDLVISSAWDSLDQRTRDNLCLQVVTVGPMPVAVDVLDNEPGLSISADALADFLAEACAT